MDIIAEIKERLKKYPNLPVNSDSNTVSVKPENGFTVWAESQGNLITIGFEGWHEEFDNPEEALNCFAWGLSNECRIKVVSRGGKPHKWVVQRLENGSWVNESTVGLLFFQFWRRKSTKYVQNAVIS